ncbi:NUDIX hydrolase domain-like protein [Annulohypoxylon truncatum]|uniref:NUDIX hydrolase domain-like protein n=1 Tax=Annulohypoxylon truncatum TaxID=327061 RepID=UPI002007D9BC|nr:NUDIX hydrolase domain-like protein [Annulohypoxylon truncatum]KAI1210716.1 NUDIX hydrolase domain-like protein [Annulohypoxylon truncatum]
MASDGHKRTFLSLLESCDNFPYDIIPSEVYYQLFLPNDDQPHGYLLPETVQKMPWTAHFQVTHIQPRSVTVLDSSKGADTPGAVNAAFAELINTCIEQNTFHVIARTHSEPFAILSARYPVRMERFASALFGITSQGAYITAYTRDAADGQMRLWIPRRAKHLYTSPGLLDSTVAGGIRDGETPLDTLIHEADEEASLPEELVRERVRSVGVLTYVCATADDFPGEKGLVIPDIIYVHDLELPGDVVPKPNDDEVEVFYSMSVEEVRERLLNGEFKPDSAAVLIDFFIRHGIITAANERDYIELNTRLHRRLPFRTPLQKLM